MPSDLALRHAKGDEELAGIIDQALEEVLALIRDWRDVLENKQKVVELDGAWNELAFSDRLEHPDASIRVSKAREALGLR